MKKVEQWEMLGFGLLLLVHFGVIVRLFTQVEDEVKHFKSALKATGDVVGKNATTIEQGRERRFILNERTVRNEENLKYLLSCCRAGRERRSDSNDN